MAIPVNAKTGRRCAGNGVYNGCMGFETVVITWLFLLLVDHLSKYLAMRIALDKQGFCPDSGLYQICLP